MVSSGGIVGREGSGEEGHCVGGFGSETEVFYWDWSVSCAFLFPGLGFCGYS